jgi:hypothetical protein
MTSFDKPEVTYDINLQDKRAQLMLRGRTAKMIH